jgi:hypothetical protein
MIAALSPSVSTHLPAGTVVHRHLEWLCFSITWESPRGRHMVHSTVPTSYVEERRLWPLLDEAVRDFNLAIALEAHDDTLPPAEGL